MLAAHSTRVGALLALGSVRMPRNLRRLRPFRTACGQQPLLLLCPNIPTDFD